ncbi:hypothetical protein [Thiolapillus sp.]|uniref:hypothetical protein n=1 Tax=Thiolapillus sp. TaxID=2017437 RepID=UPI003AF7B54F
MSFGEPQSSCGVFKWPYLSRKQNHTLGVDEIEVENEQGVVKQDIFMEKKC